MNHPPHGSRPLESANHEVVERYFRAWNDADAGRLDGVLAEEWTEHSYSDRQCAPHVAQAIHEHRDSRTDTHIFIDAVLGKGDIITVNGRVAAAGHLQDTVWTNRMEDNHMREMWTHANS